MEDEHINMDHEHNRRVMIAIAIFLTLLGIVYVYVFDPFLDEARHLPVGISDFRDRSSYQIDATTIIATLDSGQIDAFEPMDSSLPTQVRNESVSWQQAEFVKVARALNQSIWEEPLSNWRLYSMHFSTDCQDNPSGFTEADFYYFKTVFRDNGKIRYTTQNFFVSPKYGQVTWAGGSNFSHPLFGWESIRLSRIQITAEDALTIAEENGGKETRLLVKNQCRIHVRLASDQAWQILIYQNDTNSSLFRMEIDPETGKIE